MRRRLYSLAVRVHCAVYFSDWLSRPPRTQPDPLCISTSDIACDLPCEVVGGCADCDCLPLGTFDDDPGGPWLAPGVKDERAPEVTIRERPGYTPEADPYINDNDPED